MAHSQDVGKPSLSHSDPRLPNERMQLTWLLGAPGRPVSAHRRVVGRVGLGSPATQLMWAVRPLLQVGGIL